MNEWSRGRGGGVFANKSLRRMQKETKRFPQFETISHKSAAKLCQIVNW